MEVDVRHRLRQEAASSARQSGDSPWRRLKGRCRKPSAISLERYLERCHGSSLFALPKPVPPHPRAPPKGGGRRKAAPTRREWAPIFAHPVSFSISPLFRRHGARAIPSTRFCVNCRKNRPANSKLRSTTPALTPCRIFFPERPPR